MSAFRGRSWFAWYPVTVSDNGRQRIAWLENVWRDEFHRSDGTVTVRYYTR